VNLTINKGETIAIVGENGAGKSTLARLITGLYLPTKGEVYIDGEDTKTVAADAIFQNISAVFQRYQRYKMTLRQNISISSENSDKNIRDAMSKADIPTDAGSFSDGEDTMLGRDFGGVDLSGGQWQRIALARSVISSAPLRILDEPTASLDPISESNIYEEFEQISRGGTTIFISHRLGSTKLAKEIFVIENGTIIEKGTHEELMAANGVYAGMYESQRSWYL
jgi:ATP-binding cassette subfamily B protein